MGDVARLATVKGELDPDVVRAAQAILDAVRAGEVQAFAVVLVKGRQVSTAVVGDCDAADVALGLLTLQHQIASAQG